MAKPKIKWKDEPETEDYEGGKNFLTLICSDAEAQQLIEHLQKSENIERASKDLLRAARFTIARSNPTRMSVKT